MGVLINEMRNARVLIGTGGREPDMLELVVVCRDGATAVTDGPFTESKEFVDGYALFEVKDRADAIAWTNRFLDLVGNATCQLHEVGSTPP